MNQKFRKPVSYAVKIIGLFLIIFTIMAFGESVSYIIVTGEHGTLGFEDEWIRGIDTCRVVINVNTGSPAYKSGISTGDTIVRINNSKFDRDSYQQLMGLPLIGRKANITIQKNGILKDFELVYVPSPVYDKFLELLFRIIPALLMLIYILVGFWGIIKSPLSKETIYIAMFCFCFGSFMFTTIGFSVVMETFFSRYLYFNELKSVVMIFSLFGTSFWLLLFATFPLRTPFLTKHRIISYTFTFLLPIIIIISFIFELRLNAVSIFTIIVINMVVGVYLLKANTTRVKTALERRQIRLMFLGIKYGAFSVGIGWMVILITEFVFSASYTLSKYIGMTIFLLGEIGGLIIPFTFLNSFFQNKLLETETALKKRIRYVGVTLGLLTVYLSVIFVIGRLSISMFNITDPTLVIVMVLFLSLTFTPINKRLMRRVDEKFYPERTKYTASLRQLIQNVSGYIESGALLSHLAEWIKNTTGIRNIVPVVFDGQLSLSGIPFSIEGQNSVINRVKDGNKFFWDEISDKSRIPVNESEFEWALDNEISVTIPMISQGELMGLLNIGRKENYEDYSAEDLDILTQASNQAALALQNIKLQSEYLDKKRIDKEMEVARNIQKQLMPQEIPLVQGLDIYGESRPCNEVAGDYFDIINMEDGNSVIVVADVSGKGAGAAIIMANLQASIRLGIHLSDKLADFVARINNLIHVNTSSAEFITFFMAIWDPKTRVLYYVNAGHNPPILIDKDNNVTKLDATGLIIGVLPNQQYEEKYVRIKEGDALLIYTDGLDEARNDKEDFYGLERIINFLIANKNLSSKEIIEALNQDALAFCNGVPLQDDVTLIAAKGV